MKKSLGMSECAGVVAARLNQLQGHLHSSMRERDSFELPILGAADSQQQGQKCTCIGKIILPAPQSIPRIPKIGYGHHSNCNDKVQGAPPYRLKSHYSNRLFAPPPNVAG